jgi:2-polyprenyl-3-methyl-5-hydroxy-6-metoxy-1,4-benzoquinol methylase
MNDYQLARARFTRRAAHRRRYAALERVSDLGPNRSTQVRKCVGQFLLGDRTRVIYSVIWVDLEVDFETIRQEAAHQYGVAPDIHLGDMIWRYILHHPNYPAPEPAVRHYFSDGAESARKLESIIREHLPSSGSNRKVSILEFASGYGMVTRHLANMSSQDKLVACDIHQQAVDFIHDRLHQQAVLSRHVPEEVSFGESFDVVFALSFFSHIPEVTFERWLATLLGAVIPGGILVFTTHGLASQVYFGDITLGDNGFWFKPTSEQADLDPTEYGSSVTTPAYVVAHLAHIPDASLAEFRRGFWWHHQDLYVVSRVARLSAPK